MPAQSLKLYLVMNFWGLQVTIELPILLVAHWQATLAALKQVAHNTICTHKLRDVHDRPTVLAVRVNS